MSDTVVQTEASDGRNLRRDRNRDAVVTALLAIYREGDLNPSADKIAARAGLSVRSLFRYFEDVDALVRTAIARQQQHLAPLYAVDASPDQPLTARIDHFVAARVRLLDGMGEVGRVARALAPRQPLLGAELARIRDTLRQQLTALFATELDDLPPAERQAMVAAADVITSWESYDLMRHDQRLSRDDAARAMTAALLRLLAPDAGTEHGGRR